MLRYFSFAECSRRAHLRLFRAIHKARRLAHDNPELGRQGRRNVTAAYDALAERAEAVLDHTLPQTWCGGLYDETRREPSVYGSAWIMPG